MKYIVMLPGYYKKIQSVINSAGLVQAFLDIARRTDNNEIENIAKAFLSALKKGVTLSEPYIFRAGAQEACAPRPQRYSSPRRTCG